MARIAGVDLPGRKHTVIALQYIYGVGPTKAREICAHAGIPHEKRADDLDETDIKKIRELLESSIKVEGDLRRDVAADIRRKVEIGSYEGIRHRKGLPVRGQRTKTNARTRKGPKRTVAGKKKAARK